MYFTKKLMKEYEVLKNSLGSDVIHGFHWHCNNFTMLSKNQRKLSVISSHGSHYFMIMKLEKLFLSVLHSMIKLVNCIHTYTMPALGVFVHVTEACVSCGCCCLQNASMDWRKKLDSQKGAVLATEIKNNGFKVAKWTISVILAGSAFIKFGSVNIACHIHVLECNDFSGRC